MPTSELYGSDAYAPNEIAQRLASVGVAKARLATLPLLMRGTLAATMPVTWPGMLRNLVPVIAGDLVGGSVRVGLTYYVIYGRKTKT